MATATTMVLVEEDHEEESTYFGTASSKTESIILLFLQKDLVELRYTKFSESSREKLEYMGPGPGLVTQFSTRNSGVNLFSLELEIRNST